MRILRSLTVEGSTSTWFTPTRTAELDRMVLPMCASKYQSLCSVQLSDLIASMQSSQTLRPGKLTGWTGSSCSWSADLGRVVGIQVRVKTITRWGRFRRSSQQGKINSYVGGPGQTLWHTNPQYLLCRPSRTASHTLLTPSCSSSKTTQYPTQRYWTRKRN